MTAKYRIPLAAQQQAVAVELQGTLIDLLDLTLIGKHLHWNVEGRHFRSVHHELDELVEAWRRLSDDVAERLVTIGASPDGQAETIAGATQLEPLPDGHVTDHQVLRAVRDRVAAAARRARDNIDRVTVADPISGDLLVGVAGTLEKQLWMINAQIADDRRASADGLGMAEEHANRNGGS